jgi:2-polyprenyl-3-methyl-5-hydroxy-6-metoxy-1,4-benzoquinol methylase
VLLYALLDKLNRAFHTGNKRFEFERLYLEHGDPWNFRNSAYEQRKYERTLARILEWRAGSERALELACSIGVFSKMLAPHFEAVVASDISEEALRGAADYCREYKNISFIRRDLGELSLDGSFDVIVCAEVLYYVPLARASSLCQQMERQLRPRGIIVIVGEIAAGWETILSKQFQRIFSETVPDSTCAYKIMIFQKRRA